MACVRTILLLAILCLMPADDLRAQCFASPGNPIAGSTNLGILLRGKARVIGFYQHGLSDEYFEGRSPSDYDPPGAIGSAHYHYTGFSLGYGLTQRLTLEAEAGYFLRKAQEYKYLDYELRGQGLSNAVLSAKVNVYSDPVRLVELSLSAGPKLPFSTRPQAAGGVELPVDVQPSTGNFGAVLQYYFIKEFDGVSIRLILTGRYENHFTENRQGYRFGDAQTHSLYVSKHLANRWTGLTKDLTLILQARYEYRGQNHRHGQLVDFSGSQLLWLSPQLNYNLNLLWNFSVILDLPVYRNYRGIQLAGTRALTFSVARDIGFRL
jgi:hypothetical protein